MNVDDSPIIKIISRYDITLKILSHIASSNKIFVGFVFIFYLFQWLLPPSLPPSLRPPAMQQAAVRQSEKVSPLVEFVERLVGLAVHWLAWSNTTNCNESGGSQ